MTDFKSEHTGTEHNTAIAEVKTYLHPHLDKMQYLVNLTTNIPADVQSSLDLKVNNTGNETIAGNKTFSGITHFAVPSLMTETTEGYTEDPGAGNVYFWACEYGCLHLRDHAGDTKTFAQTDMDFAEMYLNENATALTPTKANEWIGLNHFIAPLPGLNGFTQRLGGIIVNILTASTSLTGTTLTINETAHGLEDGDYITTFNWIAGNAEIVKVTYIDANNFSIETGNGEDDFDYLMAAQLVCVDTGYYKLTYNVSSHVTNAQNNKYRMCLGQAANDSADPTLTVKTASKRKYANSDWGSISGQGLSIALAAGDRIFLIQKSDSTNAITHEYGSVILTRV